MIRVLLSAPLCLHIRLSSRFASWPDIWIVPHDDGVTGLDDACEFPGGEGMREGKPDDLLWHMGRHAFFDGGLPTGMGQGPVIQEADDTCALKAAPGLPQWMIRDACRAALLRQRTLALEDRASCLVAC